MVSMLLCSWASDAGRAVLWCLADAKKSDCELSLGAAGDDDDDDGILPVGGRLQNAPRRHVSTAGNARMDCDPVVICRVGGHVCENGCLRFVHGHSGSRPKSIATASLPRSEEELKTQNV